MNETHESSDTLNARTKVRDGVVATLCRQCDMHCGILVHLRDGRIRRVTGDRRHPENQGHVCAKAGAIVDLLYHPDRLRRPLKRQGGRFVPVSYEQAMDEIAERLLRIRARHGARAIGVWAGEAIGFLQQEEYARRFIHAFGSPNFFSAESVCYASRHIAYCLVQGYYNPCPDFARSVLAVLWGSNAEISHPPYMRSIHQARAKGGKLVVVDPRQTPTARKADLFLQLRPGTDAALALGLARHLIEAGGVERGFIERHVLGFDRFRRHVQRFTPKFVAQETGVAANRVTELGELLAAAGNRLALYPGVSLEHQPNGLDTVRAIACLNALSGAVDVPGGNLWPQLPGTRSLALYDRLPLSDQQPIGAERFPLLYRFRRQCHSPTAMDRILGGGPYRLRGLLLSGANPVMSNPNAAKVARAFESLELLVVRDLFLTESAGLAHYVLPAASFLERSEIHIYPHRQKIALTTKVLETAEVTDEYAFWHDLAHRLDFGREFFPWPDEGQVNQWILEGAGIEPAALAERPEGLSYAPFEYRKYDRQPFHTPSGKLELCSPWLEELGYSALPEYVPPPEVEPDSAYPLLLITGARGSFFYLSRYRNVARFRRAVPSAEVELHPQDAARLCISDGQRVQVTSRIGSIRLRARVVGQSEILPGLLQIMHGWQDANVNLLTDDADLDPSTGYPNLKRVAVKLEPVA